MGKTSLLLTYTTGEYPEEYMPTVFETFMTERMVRTPTTHVLLPTAYASGRRPAPQVPHHNPSVQGPAYPPATPTTTTTNNATLKL